MIPLHHSNRPNVRVDSQSLSRKTSRPAMGRKPPPPTSSGSSGNYMSMPPPYYEMPPPPRSNPHQPAILSLHQPIHSNSNTPYLVPPPPTPTSSYGSRRRSSNTNGWPAMTPQRLSFDDDMSVVTHCQGSAPARFQYQAGSTVSFYCERLDNAKPRNRSYWKGIIFFAMLMMWGFAAYKLGFFQLNHPVDLGIRDAYDSFIDSDWMKNLTVDRFSQSVKIMKEQMESMIKTQSNPEFQGNPDTTENIILFSINEDAESTVEVVYG